MTTLGYGHKESRSNGRNDNVRWVWHHLQPDLPAHLQFVASFYGMDFPWKHLSVSAPEFYGCADVDAPQRIMGSALDDLQRRGLRDSYERHVMGLHPILLSTSDRGLPIDESQRMMMSVELDQAKRETNAELQAMYPDSIRRCSPKAGYVRDPKSTDGLVVREFEVDVKVKTVDKDGFCVTDIKKDTVKRWCRLEPFATSPQQLVKYMKLRGHPVPKKMKETDLEGNPKDSTEDKELERLYVKTGDILYDRVRELRKYVKLKSTYVDGFMPASDGCVHTTFTFAPATGQLSSRNPNIQNVIKHFKNEREERLVRQFRRCITAQPGHRLVEFDWRSFHACTLALEANDPDYLRAARHDIHSLVAGEILKFHSAPRLLEMSDDELDERLRYFKSDPERKRIRDKKAKPSILGIGFGLGARKLFQMNRESFDGENDAKRVLSLLHDLFPRVFAWQDEICQLAHRQTYLISRYKFIRWFFDVFHWDAKRRKMTSGDDHEAAIAFLPANSAFGHVRDVMLALEREGWNERAKLVNSVHDSLLFHMPDLVFDDAVPAIRQAMSAPNPVLDGLFVDVDVSVGRSWGNMEELKLPQTQVASTILNESEVSMLKRLLLPPPTCPWRSWDALPNNQGRRPSLAPSIPLTNIRSGSSQTLKLPSSRSAPGNPVPMLDSLPL